MQQFVHGKCTSFTTLMQFLKFAVDKFSSALHYVDHVMPLGLLLIMHALAGSVDPGNFRNIFNVAK